MFISNIGIDFTHSTFILKEELVYNDSLGIFEGNFNYRKESKKAIPFLNKAYTSKTTIDFH